MHNKVKKKGNLNITMTNNKDIEINNIDLDPYAKTDEEYYAKNRILARHFVKNKSLVRYKRINHNMSIVFDLGEEEDSLDNSMGVIVGHVSFTELGFVDSLDNKTPEQKYKIVEILKNLFSTDYMGEGQKDNNTNPLSNTSLENPQGYQDALEQSEPSDVNIAPSTPDDTHMEDLTSLDKYYDGKYQGEVQAIIKEEIEAIKKEQNDMTDEEFLLDEVNSGWVKVAWMDRGITTLEHVSFLEELTV